MFFNQPGVYCFWNKASNKIYVGSAVCLNKRIRSHIKGYNSNPHLQNAIKKYGLNQFCITNWALETHEKALILEQKLLNYLFVNNIACYNISNSAKGGYLGPTIEEKRLTAIRDIKTRKKVSGLTIGENNPRCKTNPKELELAIQKYISNNYTTWVEFNTLCFESKSNISYKIRQSVYYGWNWRSLTIKYPTFCLNPYKASDLCNYE